MQDEFELLGTFNHLLRRWWIILVIAIVGGLAGLGVSMMLKPLYQAEGIINASIDFTEINFDDLVDRYGDPVVFTQYDEDLALQVVQRIAFSRSDDTFEYALTLDPDLTQEEFDKNSLIERYHAHWYLRYRHKDPEVAQAIVNEWIKKTMSALGKVQESGKAESFVIIDLISEAGLPQTPIYQNRGTLVLAGTVIGFIVGIIVVDVKKRFGKPQKSEA
jgi:uncharacterized protein involved in exopolysaccharide biosynthesis